LKIRFLRGHIGLDSPEHWRMRAEEVRVLAERKSNAAVRAMMKRIAAEYERQAEWSERQAK
jgi:hypothetical protein